MDMKIFSLTPMQAAIAMTVFVRCPEIEYIKNTDITSWIKHFKNQQANVKEEEAIAKYEHCIKLLEFAGEVDEGANLFGVYNVPVCTGNEIMLVIQFVDFRKREEFANGLEKLDAKLSEN